MWRDMAKAEDFARRHGVPRVHATADALIGDTGIDAVYIATPPSTHKDLALRVARAGKPCLVEKPMALSHAESLEMVAAFAARTLPLWVAYYRRALPRFLKVRDVLAGGAIGRITSVQVQVSDRLAVPPFVHDWRFDPSISGSGLFFDLASHCMDLLDFLIGPITDVSGRSVNTGGAYPAEDATAAVLAFGTAAIGTGLWNFNADRKIDRIVVTGTGGEVTTPVFTDGNVVVRSEVGEETTYPFRNPPHVHQPLIQTIVDELRGMGRCASTGESGARTSWVLDRCIASYYPERFGGI
jgi:1,5-anhydro-D-fructose reductase (1,5-anhydro-D-mannitol-forming)